MNDDLLQLVFGELWAMIRPVVEAVSDPAMREALLAAAGIPAGQAVSVPAADPSTIERIEAYLRKSAPALEDFVDACESAIPLAQAVRGFMEAMKSNQFNALPDEFLHQVVQLLGVPYWRSRAPTLYALFRMLGIVIPNITTHYHEEVDLDRLGHFFEDALPPTFAPKTNEEARQLSDRLFTTLSVVLGTLHKKDVLTVFQSYYGWEPAPDSASPRADGLATRTLTLALRDVSGEDPEPRLMLGLSFIPEEHGGPTLFLLPSVTENFTAALNDEWSLSLTLGLPVGTGLAIPLSGSAHAGTSADAGGEGLVSLGLERKAPRAAHFTEGVHFTVGGVQLGVNLSPERIGFRVLLKDLVLDVAKGSGDGLLQKIFPDGFSVNGKLGVLVFRDADGSLGFDLDGGIGFKKNQGRKATTPVGKSLAGFRFEHVSHELSSVDDERGKGLAAVVGIRTSTRLGPLTAILEGPSAGFDVYWKRKDGVEPNVLGLIDVGNFDLRPPTGLGLSLSAGVVQGAGYIEYDRNAGQYAGALQLMVKGKWGVDVLGLITSSPFSLLILGDVRFPPIPIGFGFSLAGLGVLLGLDRRADPQAMSQALQAGNLDALLFPSDPASKVALVVSSLGTLFPAAPGACTVGVLGRIVWGPGGLAKLDLGFVYDTSAPKRLIALGRLEVEKPLLQLKLLALGVLDFDEGELDLQLRLFESKIMGADISGDAALMLRWGSDPVFVLTIGGFHPAYHPPTRFTQKYPSLRRLSLRAHTDESILKLSLQAYFAVTSNSLQLGARVDLWAGVSGFSVEGYLAFDALIIWDPELYFDVSLEGGVALKVAGLTLFGARIRAQLIGPRSWYANGTATITVLWWDVDYDFEIGTKPADPSLPAVDGLALAAEALRDPRGWGALPASSTLVSLRRAPSSAGLVFHPLDQLAVRQQELPLGQNIDRVPKGPISGWWRFEVASVKVAGSSTGLTSLSDRFAPAQYAAMSEAEKLAAPGFQTMHSGVQAKLDDAATQPPALSIDFTYDERVWAA